MTPGSLDPLTRDLMLARDGDRVAYASFVRSTQADVWRLCAHLGGRDEADDLTQDTYVRVVRALPAFRGDASARTWLLSFARRACADSVRARIRRRRRDAKIDVDLLERDTTGGIALGALLANLDADQRTAFVLTQLHGCSYAEAAEICGVPIGTIRSRVARARIALVERVREADAV
jgi:RNA polymerase sigma-70 factor (ECF subfamily)